MYWLSEQYAIERRRDALREAAEESERHALLAKVQSAPQTHRVRQAVGGKLIEWGKRLQETRTSNDALDAANS
jgi:hypothetical protein